MKVAAVTAVALAGAAAAQSSSPSFCDKYSQALFKSTNGTVQQTLLAAVVNSAVIGNFSSLATVSPGPTGILATNATYNGKPVNLLQYFNGSLLSTNRNGKASSVNFLDGGGAAPLMQLKPANDMTSNQYMLLTHLYQYFGTLLGCSSVGKDSSFPAYQGNTNQYQVHQFMNLDENEVGYFIEQVGLAATSFGVSKDDITPIGETLTKVFNVKCGPSIPLPSNSSTPAPQSVCDATSCPQAANSTCNANNNATGIEPQMASASGSSSSGGSSMSSSGSASSPSSSSGASTGGSSGASKVASGIAGATLAAAAFFAATLL